MALLIDTNILVHLERSGASCDALLDRFGQQEMAISAITASELLHGVHRAEGEMRRARRRRFVEAILSVLPTLSFTLEVARVHSYLWADLKKSGAMIKAHDLLIAATALAHDLTLVTGDRRHFDRIELLRLARW